jgi:hypothetical protein
VSGEDTPIESGPESVETPETEVTEEPEVVAHSDEGTEQLPWCVYNSVSED